jgi:hypothetical protein
MTIAPGVKNRLRKVQVFDQIVDIAPRESELLGQFSLIEAKSSHQQLTPMRKLEGSNLLPSCVFGEID